MRRWIAAAGVGAALGLALLFVDLPFRGNVYRLVAGLRGPIPPSDDIVLLGFSPEAGDAKGAWEAESWMDRLADLERRLDAVRPRAVQLDFDPAVAGLPARTLTPPRSYPFFVEEAGARPPARNESPLFVSSPSMLDARTLAPHADPFTREILTVPLIRYLLRENPRLLREPIILNVTGPPGTYTRYEIGDLLKDPEKLASLHGKIVLVAPPPGMGRIRFVYVPFYTTRRSPGMSETELLANAVDTIAHDRGIRMLPGGLVSALTVAVSTVTVLVLFATTPLLGILAVILELALLLLAAVALLASNLYFDIHGSLAAIFLAYYFLIPYRLIVEYKGRWRYQQESKLRAEVETLKDNFMSLVSHNLKSPIARIQGAVEALLRNSDLKPESARKDLHGVLEAGEDLNRFVSRILNLAQVERPDFRLRTVAKDLNLLVEKAVEDHRSAATAKRIGLNAKLEPLFPIQVVANLVENAIKYTPEGGTVAVTTGEENDWVFVKVADSGPGIPPADADKIFSKFFRGAEIKNKGIRGSGLGLYLVRYFVELHGGRVEFRNLPEGGSEFTIYLLRS
jgi:signal transduction histidine kinase